jgi:hypothetical protein
MATVTRLVLMENLVPHLHEELPYIRLTLTGGSTTTAVAALVPRYDTNILTDKWVYVESTTDAAAPAGESMRILSVASTTITVTAALTAALGSGDIIRVYEKDPEMMHNALDRAARHLSGYPGGLYLSLLDETLQVDNLLANGSLDTFSTTFTNWANIGTPELVSETARRIHGGGSAKITASSDTEGIEQNLFDTADIETLADKTLKVRGWLWASAADAVRIRVTSDGSTFTASAFHTGGSQWERIEVDFDVESSPTELTVSCEVTDDNVGYFDLMRAYIDRINLYTIPADFYPYGPHYVEQQVFENKPEGSYLPLLGSNQPIPGMVLRLIGEGRLTIPATDSATIELDERQTEIIVKQAAAFLLGTGQDYRGETRQLQAAMGAGSRDIWNTMNDSGTLYLRLYR